MGCKTYTKIENAGLNFAIKEIAGENEYTLFLSSFYDKKSLTILPGEHEIQIYMPYLGLRPGIYSIGVTVRKDSLHTLDSAESFRFTVEGNGQPMGRCLFYQPRTWGIADTNNDG